MAHVAHSITYNIKVLSMYSSSYCYARCGIMIFFVLLEMNAQDSGNVKINAYFSVPVISSKIIQYWTDTYYT